MKYDYDLGRFTCPDPLWEKYYSWTPYQYCLNNPVKFIDPNGNDAVAVVNGDNITIKAVYVVGVGYTEADINKMQADVNKFLNSQGYEISEGEYAGKSVSFDLQFVPGDDGTVFLTKESFGIDGNPIGNELQKGTPEELGRALAPTEEMKSNFEVYGGTTLYDNIISINSEKETFRINIHELFHTFHYDNDDSESGIGSYIKDDMPNQNDINNMIYNTDLPKVEKK